jgi:hypothetical protein
LFSSQPCMCFISLQYIYSNQLHDKKGNFFCTIFIWHVYVQRFSVFFSFPSVVVVVRTFSVSRIIFCYFISTECHWQPFSFLFAHFIIRFRVVLNVQWHYVRFELVIGLSGRAQLSIKYFGLFWDYLVGYVSSSVLFDIFGRIWRLCRWNIDYFEG